MSISIICRDCDYFAAAKDVLRLRTGKAVANVLQQVRVSGLMKARNPKHMRSIIASVAVLWKSLAE
jgi:hypothetical protein